jgi:predicted TIM-barrel fold metal-dependent hydrolase
MVEEWAGGSGGRLVPLIVVPMWDAELSAQEIRRNAERGVRAVTFTELPHLLGQPSIHDKDGYWEPFIEACDETQTVICMHIGSSSDVARTSADAPLAVCMSTVTFYVQLSFTDWMFSGHLQRRPNLKLAFSEGQLGWMPFVLERIDRVWRNGNAVAGIDSSITEPPSTYLNGRVYGCFYEDTFGVKNRYELGVDMFTFESDYPHQDSNWPYTQKVLSEALHGLPEAEQHAIARGNALRMLELEDVQLVDPSAF